MRWNGSTLKDGERQPDHKQIFFEEILMCKANLWYHQRLVPIESFSNMKTSSKSEKPTGSRKAAVKKSVNAAKKGTVAVVSKPVVVTSARLPIGRSLHIGLNVVDTAGAYKRYEIATLKACLADASDFAAIATKQKFSPVIKITNNACTMERVLSEIKAASDILQSGDIFLLTYSGHGGQEKIPKGRKNTEPDGMDETWCLFNGELLLL